MITIGVDVGVTGAIALLDDAGQLLGVRDLPICVNGALKWIDGPKLLTIIRNIAASANDKHAQAFVERTQPMPKKGVVAANQQGLTLGSVLSTLHIAGVSTELVVPAVWKKTFGLLMPNAKDGAKKEANRTKARMLFPACEDLERVKDHNRAEAMLIALYGYRLTRGDRAAA